MMSGTAISAREVTVVQRRAPRPKMVEAPTMEASTCVRCTGIAQMAQLLLRFHSARLVPMLHSLVQGVSMTVSSAQQASTVMVQLTLVEIQWVLKTAKLVIIALQALSIRTSSLAQLVITMTTLVRSLPTIACTAASISIAQTQDKSHQRHAQTARSTICQRQRLTALHARQATSA